jgi:hypothetical protein
MDHRLFKVCGDILLLYYPYETPQLMKYGEIVRDLAHRRPGMTWSFYDNQFRLSREHARDRLHTEFWVMATTPPPSMNNHFPKSHRPFRTGSGRFFRSTNFRRQSKYLDNTCWSFNKRGVCRDSKCPHPHIRGFCRGTHHSGQCSFPSKEQATAFNIANWILSSILRNCCCIEENENCREIFIYFAMLVNFTSCKTIKPLLT